MGVVDSMGFGFCGGGFLVLRVGLGVGLKIMGVVLRWVLAVLRVGSGVGSKGLCLCVCAL